MVNFELEEARDAIIKAYNTILGAGMDDAAKYDALWDLGIVTWIIEKIPNSHKDFEVHDKQGSTAGASLCSSKA